MIEFYRKETPCKAVVEIATLPKWGDHPLPRSKWTVTTTPEWTKEIEEWIVRHTGLPMLDGWGADKPGAWQDHVPGYGNTPNWHRDCHGRAEGMVISTVVGTRGTQFALEEPIGMMTTAPIFECEPGKLYLAENWWHRSPPRPKPVAPNDYDDGLSTRLLLRWKWQRQVEVV